MRPIPLNFQTLYADLLQSLGTADVAHGSVTVRRIKGQDYLYLTAKDGSQRRQTSLGRADDPAAQAKAEAIHQAAQHAKGLRTTVSALKKAHIPAPSLPLGRVLEVVANAGLFKQGVMLVGTAAYQTYPCLVGAYLPSSVLMTNDADLLVSSFVARDDKLPKMFKAANNFQVDVLTQFGRGRKSPIIVDDLQCSAEALNFMEYLGEESTEAVALYGTGVLISVPPPTRYAIHKLLIAQERRSQSPKRTKDLKQANDLIDVLLETDSMSLEEAIQEARERGPKWKRNIDASLRDTKHELRQMRLFPMRQPLKAKRRSR
jgi:hypothetical protein